MKKLSNEKNKFLHYTYKLFVHDNAYININVKINSIIDRNIFYSYAYDYMLYM